MMERFVWFLCGSRRAFDPLAGLKPKLACSQSNKCSQTADATTHHRRLRLVVKVCAASYLFFSVSPGRRCQLVFSPTSLVCVCVPAATHLPTKGLASRFADDLDKPNIRSALICQFTSTCDVEATDHVTR